MIKSQLSSYRLKADSEKKQAIFISFTGPVHKMNISETGEQISHLIKKDYDTYILELDEPGKINASMLKLLIMFHNTCHRKSGLLVKGNIKDLVLIPELKNMFVIGDNKKSLLQKLELSNN